MRDDCEGEEGAGGISVSKKSWSRFYEKAHEVEARALPGPFSWEGEEFARGDLMVRDPVSKETLGVYRVAEFGSRFLQAVEDQDQDARLRILLYGLQQGADRVLAEKGMGLESKRKVVLVRGVLRSLQRKECSVPLALRTLAAALLSVLVSSDDARRRPAGKELVEDQVDPAPEPGPGSSEDPAAEGEA